MSSVMPDYRCMLRCQQHLPILRRAGLDTAGDTHCCETGHSGPHSLLRDRAQRATLTRIAEEHGVPIVDVRPLFAEESGMGIPGDEVFLDHVHPTISGHQAMADALLQEMAGMKLLQIRRQGWRTGRSERYRTHLASLDHAYFARGKERLEGLQRWTQGRSPKVRPAVRP